MLAGIEIIRMLKESGVHHRLQAAQLTTSAEGRRAKRAIANI